MPYKRKVRLLFLASGDACRALLALTISLRLGAAQLETCAFIRDCLPLAAQLRHALNTIENLAESFTLPGAISSKLISLNEPTSDRVAPSLDEAITHWADLVLFLDSAAKQACPRIPPRVQRRDYFYTPVLDLNSFDEVRARLEQRIAGILGGLAMMSA